MRNPMRPADVPVPRTAASRVEERSTGNAILDALPPDERELVRRHLRVVPLRLRQTLVQAGAPLTSVYFPLSGVLALIALAESGRTVEANMVGREGMIGLPAFLGVNMMPVEVVVQLSGRALALPVPQLRLLTTDRGALSSVLKRYTYTRMVETTQNAACHRLHSLEQRTARWLLETADRAGRTEFWITHEVLADLLGVQRPRVSEMLSKLQSDGLVDSPRARIRLTDEARLRQAACECYAVLRDQVRGLVTMESPAAG